jgi:sugar diacid utilization regulator
MNLPLYLIIDALSEYPVENHMPRPYNRMYQGVILLPDPPVNLDPTLLHFSTLSYVVDIGGIREDVSCICVRDRDRDDRETEEVLRGLLIIDKNYPVGFIYHKLHLLFLSISDWEKALLDCIIRKDMASLVSLSESIIGNPILVTDSALATLGFTPGIDCDDPLWTSLVQKRTPPDPSLRQLLDIVSASPQLPGRKISISKGSPLSADTLAVSAVRLNRSYNVFIIMTCSRRPPNKSIIELFSRLSDKIETYIRSNLYGPAECQQPYNSFICDLIESKITDQELIKQRCAFFGIKYDADLFLCAIRLNSAGSSSLAWAMDELSSLLPKARLTLYKDFLVAVMFQNRLPATRVDEQMASDLSVFLEKYNALCGISDFTDSISKLGSAYAQCCSAIDTGMRVYKNSLLTDEEAASLRLLRNKRIFCYGLFSLCATADEVYTMRESLFTDSFYFQALSKLYSADRQNHLNNLKLLYIFLLTERQYVLTAKVLHMHRNNVYYHISRLQEHLQLDLDDAQARCQLLLAYQLINIRGVEIFGKSAADGTPPLI